MPTTSTISQSAYLLVTHGSRDPRPQNACRQLAKILIQALSQITPKNSFPIVETAVLELGEVPLHQQIVQFSQTLEHQNICSIQILPLFLLPGVHVCEDIPAEIELAQNQLGDKIPIQKCPYLGSHPLLSNLLEQAFQEIPSEGRILLSHGSRRLGGNEPTETLAKQLNAVAAYWSIPPDLETQMTQLMKQKVSTLAIVPYFLFPGGITEAIAQQVTQLQSQYPHVQLKLGQPLGATPELAHILRQIIQEYALDSSDYSRR